VATVLWMCSRFHNRPPVPQRADLEAALWERRHTFNFVETSNILFRRGATAVPPPRRVACMHRDLGRGGLNPYRPLTPPAPQTLSAFAPPSAACSLGVLYWCPTNPELVEAMLDRVLRRPNCLTPWMVCNMLWGCARLSRCASFTK
jgi:hypothetical protein